MYSGEGNVLDSTYSFKFKVLSVEQQFFNLKLSKH